MTTSPRLDLYAPIHKGLRLLLTDLTARVARAPSSDDVGAARIRAAVVRAVDFLREHAAHEDAHVEPLYLTAAPELARELRGDHRGFERREDALLAQVDHLVTARGTERSAIGAALQAELIAYVQLQFQHMRREETAGNAALWAGYDDVRLSQVHLAITSSIPPERTLEWLEVFLPAWTVEEAGTLLADVRATAPRAFADRVFAAARRILGDRWDRLPVDLRAA